MKRRGRILVRMIDRMVDRRRVDNERKPDRREVDHEQPTTSSTNRPVISAQQVLKGFVQHSHYGQTPRTSVRAGSSHPSGRKCRLPPAAARESVERSAVGGWLLNRVLPC